MINSKSIGTETYVLNDFIFCQFKLQEKKH